MWYYMGYNFILMRNCFQGLGVSYVVRGNIIARNFNCDFNDNLF